MLWRNGPFLPLMVACMYALWALLIPDPVDVWSVRFVVPCVVAVVMLVGLTHEKTLLSKGVATLHAAAHLGVVLGLSWLFDQWVDRPWTWLLVGAAGAVVGPLVLGVYLRLADIIEINSSELFAAQRLESYKCFLRLRVSPDGDLTIYPIGIRDVVHRWRLLPAEPDGPPIAPAGPIRRGGTSSSNRSSSPARRRPREHHERHPDRTSDARADRDGRRPRHRRRRHAAQPAPRDR